MSFIAALAGPPSRARAIAFSVRPEQNEELPSAIFALIWARDAGGALGFVPIHPVGPIGELAELETNLLELTPPVFDLRCWRRTGPSGWRRRRGRPSLPPSGRGHEASVGWVYWAIEGARNRLPVHPYHPHGTFDPS